MAILCLGAMLVGGDGDACLHAHGLDRRAGIVDVLADGAARVGFVAIELPSKHRRTSASPSLARSSRVPPFVELVGDDDHGEIGAKV